MATAMAAESSSSGGGGGGAALRWPELYGFWIYGHGPTYVIYVEPGSISETAGIRAGDRIVELDNNDVSRLAAPAIKYMAHNSKNNPPAISVQSFLQEAQLAASGERQPMMFGLRVRGDMPVLVDSVEVNSSAWNAGIRASLSLLFHVFFYFVLFCFLKFKIEFC